MSASSGTEATESVRQYFARLALRGQPRAALARWASLPVETFFVAMRLPGGLLNSERRACGDEPQPLGMLFAGVRWE